MKKNRFIVTIEMILVSNLLLCACTKSANNYETESVVFWGEEVNDSTKIPVIPDGYASNVDNISVDIDHIDVPANVYELARIEAKAQLPDDDTIIDSFSKGKIIADESKSENEVTNEGRKSDSYYAEYTDGSQMYIYDGTINISDAFSDKFFNCIGEESLKKYSKDTQLSFMSREDSVDLIKNAASSYGYSIDSYSCVEYSLDYETLAEEEIIEEKVGKRLDEHSEWTENDNSYLIYMRQEYEGVPIFCGNSYFMDDEDETLWPISGIVSSNGIDLLGVNRLYSFEEVDGTYTLCDFEDCVNAVVYKYSNILYDADYEINDIFIRLLPELTDGGDYEMKLVWMFKGTESCSDEGGELCKDIYTLIDAETAEEIVL